jgi:hypothetical protein
VPFQVPVRSLAVAVAGAVVVLACVAAAVDAATAALFTLAVVTELADPLLHPVASNAITGIAPVSRMLARSRDGDRWRTPRSRGLGVCAGMVNCGRIVLPSGRAARLLLVAWQVINPLRRPRASVGTT